jgi:hypothetical protein
MIVGNFSYDISRDTYTGEITTLTLQRSNVVFRPTDKVGDREPDYRNATAPSWNSARRGNAAAIRAATFSPSCCPDRTLGRWPARGQACGAPLIEINGRHLGAGRELKSRELCARPLLARGPCAFCFQIANQISGTSPSAGLQNQSHSCRSTPRPSTLTTLQIQRPIRRTTFCESGALRFRDRSRPARPLFAYAAPRAAYDLRLALAESAHSLSKDFSMRTSFR